MGWVVLQCWLGGDAVWGLGRAPRDAPRLCQHLAYFPALLTEEKWLKKRSLENKTDEEISSLLSASLQGETLNAGPSRPAAWGGLPVCSLWGGSAPGLAFPACASQMCCIGHVRMGLIYCICPGHLQGRREPV